MPEIGRDDFDHHAKGERRICQGKLCTSNVQTEKNFAVKVCHHEDCQDINQGNPLLLCMRCDEVHHLGTGASHARFDVPERPSTNLFRTPSSHSVGSDSGNEDDLDSIQKVDKKTRGYSSGKRMFKLTTAAKKKPRRHNTEDPGREFFSIKFHNNITGDYQVEVVPALKGKSLRESLEPLFEAREFSFVTHSVFLDSSNTPLPLAFDTFPLGGNILHVIANEDVKVDERVINMVRDTAYTEDRNSVDEIPRPKSASFMARSGSFTIKGKDKDKAGLKKTDNDEKEKEKELQQLKNSQRGKKNIMSFLGDDTCGVPSSVSSPVLPGGVHVSGGGTLPRTKLSSSRLTGLFNQPKLLKDGTLRGTLKDSLDRYSLYGLEESAGYECSFKDEIEDEIKLELSWTDVVDKSKSEDLTKKQKDQQEAIWELLATEVSYISKVYVIKKLFLQCLRNLQSEGFLVDIDASKLFSNVEEICAVNLTFWNNYLTKVVENARKTKDLLNPMDMEDGFHMFESQFDPYIKYCMEEASCLKYFKEKLIESEDFRAYITWCEEHHQCTDRLKLNDLLVKPMQRVTKYPLLLKAIYSKTLDDNTKEHLCYMRDKVEAFVGKVNGAMRVKHELEKLQATADRIYDSYNVVEAVNEEMEKMLQDYSTFDLLRPMPGMANDQHRCVIHEGSLRLLEKQGKMDVYVFLFTDLLLITKAKKGDKFKVIKPPLQVDKLSVSLSKDQGTFLLIYVNEYNVAVQAFALQGTTSDQTQWTHAIKKAQKMFMVAKLGQGSPSIFQMRVDSEKDILSPSGLVIPQGLSPTSSRFKRRSSSASSIISIESDSDDESGIAFPATNSFVHSDSLRTSASSSVSSEKDKSKDTETDKALLQSKISKSNLWLQEKGHTVDNDGVARLRSDSITRISRSSSAPQHERPRVETVSLSRSSSDPQGPTRQRGPGLREGIVMKRRTLEEEEDASLTSSSVSLEDSAGDAEAQTPSRKSSHVDFPSLPAQPQQTHHETDCNELNSSDLDLSAGTADADPSNSISGTETVLTSSSQTESQTADPAEPVRWDESPSSSYDGESELLSSTDTSSPPPEMRQTPGFQALQNLSESLESTLKVNGPTRQTPPIKSHLIGQQQIKSVINTSEAPRKRATLPRRSSPVVSRKQRSEKFVSSKVKLDQDITGILQKIRVAASGSSNSADVNENLSAKVGKPTKRFSEPVRAPVKPTKSHYPAGLDLAESVSKESSPRESPVSPSESGSSLSVIRKKSMSLSDLLNIGKELTGSRDKSKDKESTKDKGSSKRTDQPSPTSPDDDAWSPSSVDGHDKKEEKKYSRLSKLRRRSSRGTDMKDGIASGPNIDPKKASRHFFKESLMLESSEYV